MVKPLVATALWSSSLTLMIVWSAATDRMLLLGWAGMQALVAAVLTAWSVLERERLRMEHLADLMVTVRDGIDDVAHLR